MPNDQGSPRDSARADARRNGRADRRRDRRDWWRNAAAWDPEHWRAMASAWAQWWEHGPESIYPSASPTATATAGPTAAGMKACPFCAEEIRAAAVKCKHCRTWLAPPPGSYAPAPGTDDDEPFVEYASPPPRRLTRSATDATLYGVLGGLGRHLNVDPTWLRIAFALGTLATAILPGVVVYVTLAYIIPADATVKGPAVET